MVLELCQESASKTELYNKNVFISMPEIWDRCVCVCVHVCMYTTYFYVIIRKREILKPDYKKIIDRKSNWKKGRVQRPEEMAKNRTNKFSEEREEDIESIKKS